MIESSPFNSPEFKEQVLKSEGILDSNGSNDEYEILQQEDSSEFSIDNFDLKSLVKNAPQIPKSAKNIIMDASALAKNEKEAKALEMNMALNDVFSQYNKQYGTDLHIDFSSLSKTLVDVANPETRRTLELFTSEIFKSIKPILLLHLISKLSLAIEYVLQPERMFDQSQLSIPDLFLVIEKLEQYILNLNDILETSTIEDSDMILKKLSEEKNDSNLNSDESKKAVEDFMNLLKKENGINK